MVALCAVMSLAAACSDMPKPADGPDDSDQAGRQKEEEQQQQEPAAGTEGRGKTDGVDGQEASEVKQGSGAGGDETDEAGPTIVRSGDMVRVHCTGTLENGEVFDSYQGGRCLQFSVGERDLPEEIDAEFEDALVGMKVGETTSFTIAAADAYGAHDEDLVFTVDWAVVPEGQNVELGKLIHFTHQRGFFVTGQVTEITASNITVDANHPLAGENLTFEVELVDILG